MPFLRTSAVAAAAATVGLAAGVGAYTFGYARGASYLTDDPRACANCHVMEEQLAAWTKSSHRAVAVCNDCHTPPGLVPKYFTKALNGWHHSVAFTTGDFPDPIRITPRNRAVTEQACRKCHAPIVAAIEAASGAHAAGAADRLACLACHRDVGHLH
jgi:cytochrome c nitrite reductase small subunit